MLRADLFHLMNVFRAVVRTGSFPAAATALGTKPPAVSKAIAKLETDLGVQLLLRSTRSMSLTESGEEFYHETARMLDEVEALHSAISNHANEPAGTLRVSATAAFGQSILAPVLPAFLVSHPKVLLDLRLTDSILNMHADGLDIVFRSTPELEDTTLYSRLISTQKRVIVAAPAYLERYGTPETPRALANHACLVFKAKKMFNRWRLSQQGKSWTIAVQPVVICNNYHSIVEAACGGVGIAQVFQYHVADKIKDGTLTPLLTDYTLPDQNVFAVYHQKRKQSPKLDAFVSHIEKALRPS